MLKYAVAYLTALVVLLAVDMVWLGFIARDFYKSQLGGLMAEKPLLGAAAAFYLLYPVGVTLFAVTPGLRETNWASTALLGLVLGLVAYGTYDLSNLATLKNWPVTLTLVDMSWGAALTMIAAVAAYFAAVRVG